MLRERPSSYRLDSLALVISGLCAVHCLAGLWLLAGLATAGGLLLSPVIHEVGLMLALPIAALALGLGAAKHRDFIPLTVGLIGIVVMAWSLTLHSMAGGVLMTMCGVALLSIGHILNLQAAQAD